MANQTFLASNAATSSQPVVREHVTCMHPGVLNDCGSTAYENIEIVTRSHPDAFPSPLHQKRKTQTKVHAGEDALLRVRSRHPLRRLYLITALCPQVTEKCPSCGHMEAFSKELQVRGSFSVGL